MSDNEKNPKFVVIKEGHKGPIIAADGYSGPVGKTKMVTGGTSVKPPPAKSEKQDVGKK